MSAATVTEFPDTPARRTLAVLVRARGYLATSAGQTACAVCAIQRAEQTLAVTTGARLVVGASGVMHFVTPATDVPRIFADFDRAIAKVEREVKREMGAES